MNNLDIVKQTIGFARQAGADQAEALLSRRRVLTIEVSNGKVETIKQAEDQGLAVRALVGKRIGLSYATDLSEASLRRAAQRAVEIARASDADEFVGFAEPNPIPTLAGFDPEMEQHSIDEKIERAFAIERAARQYDARIVLTRRITYAERESVEAIANTRGLVAEQRNNGCGGGGMVIARDAKEQEVGFGSDAKRRYAEFDPVKIGVEAAEKAVQMLGATNVATQRASILLEPKMTGAFLGIIASLVSADNVQKGKSLLAGKIGQAVAASGVTLVDDGAFADAPGMRAFDDEGVPSQRTIVIADGILHNYLHSTYTARKANTRSTGNATRASFKTAPEAQPSNFYLCAGTASPDALRASIARGLWVRNLMNLHTANPISGEFSFGANGLWIENGNIVGPVRGVTISGNLTEWLRNIRGIGNDVVWQGGYGISVGAPSVLIEDVSIAGR
jgi:PmbA protein